ncbi:hypothetical protein GCM10009017_03490 [Halarchaeum rubridurum]|uniref:Uncharacterized protein n=1 Tax=Halarchaeum rubridurum TaxID=489911 RepID=A0A830FTA2_9EURY|nr:hypothetical protein GCM10009017_03490 [Halarchaeum rubridurum]
MGTVADEAGLGEIVARRSKPARVTRGEVHVDREEKRIQGEKKEIGSTGSGHTCSWGSSILVLLSYYWGRGEVCRRRKREYGNETDAGE